MGKHALLSASSSHRWLACPPSARLCESYEDKGSEYAQQGTDAHSLCEYKLQKALGIKADDPTENLTYYDSEMEVCAESYADYVMEQLAAAMKNCSDPIVLIEQRLDYSRFVPEGFGTGDAVIIADGQLTICDYKHGKGVLVEAEKNPQMMCYALGALELFDALYDIDTVRMVIFQPRRENVSEYIITRTELLQWAEDILVPTAKLAFDGEGEFCAGEHCRFCKAKAACRKRAEYNLELAKYDFETPAMLDDVEIEAVLSKVDELVSWAADVKEFALHAAISGKAWTDWKLVEGRSNRKYVSDEAVATAVTEAGYNPYEEKLLGVTAMTALLGKKNFVEVIESRGLIEKPQGKPVLVPMSDKRPALNTAKIWDPKSINGGSPKYSVSLLIPKSDTVTVNKIKSAIEAAYKEGESKLKGSGKSVPALSVLKTPLRDGDAERPDAPEYEGCYFVNANSGTAPGIVDADRQEIIDRSEVYSGVYGRASINFYAFNSNGNKGIACGLNNLQKIRDGEPLGGKSRAADDFATEEDEDFLG